MTNLGNKVIINLYKYRCMTFKQLLFKISQNEEDDVKIYNVLIELINQDYISYDELSAINPEVSDEDNAEPEVLIYFSLTPKGHKHYKEELVLNKLTRRYDSVEAKHILDNNILSYDKYKMSHKLSRHQLHLTNFVINFEKLYSGKLRYNDEKEYKNKYNYLKTRPDGTIETNDTIYLLEIDMSTESAQQLNAKFYKYVEIFQNSKQLYNKEKSIKILFINNTMSRGDVVRHEALSELSLFLDESDFIIGTEMEIFNILFNDTFNISETVPFNEMMRSKTLKHEFDSDINYDTFIYNGNISGLNNKLLFIDYTYNLFSITFLENLKNYHLPYSYIILINKKEDIFHFENTTEKYIFILKNDFEEYGLKASKYIKKYNMIDEI